MSLWPRLRIGNIRKLSSTLLPMGIATAIKLIPSEIMEECKAEADEKLSKDIPEAKVAGIIIVLLWLFVIGIIG